MLSEDSYLLEGLQSADKTKTHPKAELKNAPTFTGNESHSHVCLLMVIKLKTCTHQLCKRQSADTHYRQFIPVIGASPVIMLLCVTSAKVNLRDIYVTDPEKLVERTGKITC